MEEELRKALKERGYSDEEVDIILAGRDKLEDLDPIDDPPADDPEVVQVGPRLRPAEELEKDFVEGVRVKGRRFIARIRRPKKNPIAAGASDVAEGKYADKLKIIAEQKRRQMVLKGMTFEEDWAPYVEALREEDWTGPTIRKSPKWRKKWERLEEARLYAVNKLDTMPVDTRDARRRKMEANLEIMRTLGELSKGVIDMVTFRRHVDDLTKA